MNKKKYFIKSYGCAMNTSDAERIAAAFKSAGLERAQKIEDTDFIVLVTCSVRQKAEDKVYGLGEKIIDLRSKNKDLVVIVTGCMVKRFSRGNPKHSKKLKQIEKNITKRLSWADYVVDIKKAPKLVSQLLGHSKFPYSEFFNIKPASSSITTAYIPISFGCDNFCSYCVVPYTRGPLKNRPFHEILEEFKSALDAGQKEIYLLGQNVNSWEGTIHGNNSDFSDLLGEVDKLSGDYWIRFISSHPKDISNNLIDTVSESDHVTPYLHFALQSGSDKILELMNRKYGYEKFRDMVLLARKKVPGIAITTDIIVGFPGETESDFQKTVKAFEECQFDMAYIAKYSPRPGTVSAESMDDNVPRAVKEKRFQLLTDILRKHNKNVNQRLIGKQLTVLTHKIVKTNSHPHTLGRTATNKEVLIDKRLELGSFHNVTISGSTDWSLQAS